MEAAGLHPGLVLTGPGAARAPAGLVGGKAANLARLEAMGQPVPPWYCITTLAFRGALEAAGLAGRIRERLAALGREPARPAEEASREVQAWVGALELPGAAVEAVLRAHAARFPGDPHVAVRSSAADEDAAGESFAGLHDSFLFVRGRERLLEAVRRVWASAYNARALAYRREQGLQLDRIAVAVVVQEMVHAKRSGVLFTANPVTGSVHQLVASSLFGAGEGLVSAGLAADTFTVEKDTLAIAREVADKEEELVLDPEAGGLKRVPVAEGLRRAPSLSDEEVRAVARAGLEIERRFGRPQDIEFSLDGAGRIFILQSRAVTTVEEYGPAAGNRLLWDNSNIIESYSGVTSPMTFSFIRRAYAIVYHSFAEVMGISPRAVAAHHLTFENMLGLFRGQVYYNLLNWYRVVRLFPGYEFNKRFMESMMGVKEPLDPEEEGARPGRLRRWLVGLPALLRLVARSAWNFARIRSLVARFERNFRSHYARWEAMDWSGLAPHELVALYHEMEEGLLWDWKAPIVNDFFVMIFYGTLKRLCTRWCGDREGSLQNDLICGEGGIESTEPTKMLLRLARRAQDDPALRALFRERTPEDLARAIPADPRFREFAAEIARYLDLYGFRCMNELKLEEHSVRDRPGFLYQVIGNYLALDDPAMLDVGAIEARERSVRAEAERRAGEALRARGGLLPRRALFHWVLRAARLGVKNRENLRFARTRIYGLLRELLRALGARLAAEGVLDQADEVFYLTLDEVRDFVKGTAVTCDLRALAALRRAEFDRYRSGPPPDDRFETYGMAYHRNRCRDRKPEPPVPQDGVLRGTGCSPGEVTGPVKVLRSPKDDLKLAGEILVAERTDPGWVPLYPSVSGILIERGSILSHSAIVAREMGIPTIVGIPHLLAALATGQRVEMNGSAGTVRIV